MMASEKGLALVSVSHIKFLANFPSGVKSSPRKFSSVIVYVLATKQHNVYSATPYVNTTALARTDSGAYCVVNVL